MELSLLSGKPVLSPGGERLGYVKQAYVTCDFVKLAALLCADDEEEEFFLPAASVLSFGETIVADPTRGRAPAGIPSPVGKPVFNYAGAFLGTASGLTLGENGVLTVSGLGGKQLYPSKYLAAGDVVIVYPEPAARAAARRKRAERSAKTAPHVTKTENREQKRGAPSEAPDGYRMNLLGKRVQRPLLSSDGETLAQTGETVTPRVLQRAREHNRLLELTANTLTE